jgi:MerR family transcriptional regulator, mercuric resistance operon regulatory protein
MKRMTISGLAEAGGVGVETVRFYQRRGLLPVPPRAGSGINGGIRHYGADEARRLRFIKAAQAAGFSLGEIKTLLDLDASADRKQVRALARERIAALDVRIAELRAARKALAYLADACAEGTEGPCPIIASFESIAAGR